MEFNFSGFNKTKATPTQSEEDFIKARFESVGQASAFNNPENREKSITESVAGAHDLRDLFVNVIDSYDHWQYSNGDPLDRTVLKETLAGIMNGRVALEYVTSRYGLREKIKQLLELQAQSDQTYIIRQPDTSTPTPTDEAAEPEVSPTESYPQEDPKSPKEQERLAMKYLDAYARYQNLNEELQNELRVLNKLRQELQTSPEEIVKLEAEYHKLSDAVTSAMQQYEWIGNALTPETIDKYLRG